MMQKSEFEAHLNGKYSFIRTIGSGSFASVVLVVKIKTQKLYACKIFKRQSLVNHNLFNRFEQEVRLLQTFDHPNIVKIHDFIFTTDLILVMMEYCSNGELYSYISASGFLPEREVLKLLRQLLSALSYIHHKKIAHRDIKPENILLDDDLNAKIADFGMSHQIDSNSLLKTQCGSVFYVAPEVISNQPYDGAKADVWSLGVVAYSMATGRLPWTEVNQAALFKEIMEREVRFPKEIRSDIKDIILSMMERNPTKRSTIDELLEFPCIKQPPCKKVVVVSSSSSRIVVPNLPSKTKLSPIIRPQRSGVDAILKMGPVRRKRSCTLAGQHAPMSS